MRPMSFRNTLVLVSQVVNILNMDCVGHFVHKLAVVVEIDAVQ